jgi:hypothetical protein
MWVQHEYSRNCCFFVSCAACFFPQRGSSTARSRSIVPQPSFLPSFPSFFLSRCCCFLFLCGWFFRNSRVCFFFFLGFFGGLFFLCFSRFFVRATDGVPLFLNGFVEEHRTALASPSRAQFQARTVYRISEYLTSQFSHAYSGLGICHQYFGPYLPQRSCLNVNILKITLFFYQTYFLR